MPLSVKRTLRNKLVKDQMVYVFVSKPLYIPSLSLFYMLYTLLHVVSILMQPQHCWAEFTTLH